jgi:hypothetical protein
LALRNGTFRKISNKRSTFLEASCSKEWTIILSSSFHNNKILTKGGFDESNPYKKRGQAPISGLDESNPYEMQIIPIYVGA